MEQELLLSNNPAPLHFHLDSSSLLTVGAKRRFCVMLGEICRVNSDHQYFVAHVAQVSRGNAQANAVNSTDLAWSRLVRDQEDGGSNPLAPTTLNRIQQLTA